MWLLAGRGQEQAAGRVHRAGTDVDMQQVAFTGLRLDGYSRSGQVRNKSGTKNPRSAEC